MKRARAPANRSLPWGIAAEPSTGNLYVSEVGNDRVQEFSSSGTFIAAFGSAGSGAEQLSAPKGVAVSSTGAISSPTRATSGSSSGARANPPPIRSSLHRPRTTSKAASRNPKRWRSTRAGTSGSRTRATTACIEFNSKHEYLRQFGSEGSGEGQFQGIRGIATNSEGDVYVSDYANDRVQEFSPTGAFIRKFGSAGTSAGQFLHPTGLAVDSSGNVWVLSSYGVHRAGVLLRRHLHLGLRLAGHGLRAVRGSGGHRRLRREPVRL